MARLRAADLQVGDRLRYTSGKGPSKTEIVGRIDGIERAEGTPALALFTHEATGVQTLMRLGDLARNGKKLSMLAGYEPEPMARALGCKP